MDTQHSTGRVRDTEDRGEDDDHQFLAIYLGVSLD